jgi:Ca2+-binding EF-hand superfamily protein
MVDVRRSVTLANSVQTDIESAKAIARKIFETYDRDRSTILENYEISPLLQDVYKSMNRNFTPSKLDVESYAKVLDRNGDGRVTLQDVEALCIRYLVGEDALNRSQAGGYADAGETVKRSGYSGYNDGYGSRTYEVNASGNQGGEYVKRAGNPDMSGSGQIKVVRKTQLDEIRRIFERFDGDRSGFIDERELKNLLEETYRVLGVQRTITYEDVSSYLNMVDTNRDGRVSLPEYETIVIRSLEKNGIVLE